MTIKLDELGPGNIEQLSLGLEVDEIQRDDQGNELIDAAEAQRRSSAALQVFKSMLEVDHAKQAEYALALKKYQSKLAERRRFDISTNDLVEPEAPESHLEWAEDFFYLLDHGWPWRVAAYIAWAASPRIGRYPETQEELSNKILGLTSDRQIATWRKKNPAIDETIALMQAIPMMIYRRDVLKALAISASDPSHKGSVDRKTYLGITEDYVPHLKVDQKRVPSDPLDLSDAELDEIIKHGGKQ